LFPCHCDWTSTYNRNVQHLSRAPDINILAIFSKDTKVNGCSRTANGQLVSEWWCLERRELKRVRCRRALPVLAYGPITPRILQDRRALLYNTTTNDYWALLKDHILIQVTDCKPALMESKKSAAYVQPTRYISNEAGSAVHLLVRCESLCQDFSIIIKWK